jgi:hypothetical protein
LRRALSGISKPFAHAPSAQRSACARVRARHPQRPLRANARRPRWRHGRTGSVVRRAGGRTARDGSGVRCSCMLDERTECVQPREAHSWMQPPPPPPPGIPIPPLPPREDVRHMVRVVASQHGRHARRERHAQEDSGYRTAHKSTHARTRTHALARTHARRCAAQYYVSTTSTVVGWMTGFVHALSATQGSRSPLHSTQGRALKGCSRALKGLQGRALKGRSPGLNAMPLQSSKTPPPMPRQFHPHTVIAVQVPTTGRTDPTRPDPTGSAAARSLACPRTSRFQRRARSLAKWPRYCGGTRRAAGYCGVPGERADGWQ